MTSVDYFGVECPETVGGEMYRRLAGIVLLDLDLIRAVAKLHLFIDPATPIFVAVGTTKKIPPPVRLRDFADVNIQEGKATITITKEAYLAPLLKILWERFGKDYVDQPDRFTIVITTPPGSSLDGLPDLAVVDPAETLYKDLVYALQCIQPEGFKVRRQYYGQGRFWYVASENTLPEDLAPLVREKFALIGEAV